MGIFLKVIDETQMGNPQDHAVRDISSKFSIFLPLRAMSKKPYHYETPCRLIQRITNILLLLFTGIKSSGTILGSHEWHFEKLDKFASTF